MRKSSTSSTHDFDPGPGIGRQDIRLIVGRLPLFRTLPVPPPSAEEGEAAREDFAAG
jgi:hypothetical protein